MRKSIILIKAAIKRTAGPFTIIKREKMRKFEPYPLVIYFI